MLNERYKTQQSNFNALSNQIVSDFIKKVIANIPGQTKYQSLLKYFLGLRRKQDGTKLFSKVYKVNNTDKIRYTFSFERSEAEDFPGYFYGDEIVIGFPLGIFDFIFPESNLSKVNAIVDKLKEAIVHETTHFYQDKKEQKFDTTVFPETFDNKDVSRLGNLVYVTDTSELEAICNEAYKIYTVHKRTDRLSYYQCILLKITPFLTNTTKYNQKIIAGSFDLGDLIELLERKKNKGVIDLFALYYIFYGFIPQTKFFNLIEKESTYDFYHQGIGGISILVPNQQDLTELLELVVEHDKVDQFERIIQKMIRSGEIKQLCSWTQSNLQIVEQIGRTIFQ